MNMQARGVGGRKTVLRAAVAVLGLTLIALVGLFVFWPSDRFETFYPFLADARRHGAVDRGWIPDFLPESSHNIHELLEVSPSRGWCAFEFRTNNSEQLRRNLKTTATLPDSVKRVRNPGKTWWPAALQGNLDEKRIQKAGFELYVLIEPATALSSQVRLFAVDWGNGRGFFYSTPGDPGK